MPEFKIVDENRRRDRFGPLVKTLMAGKTVALAADFNASGTFVTLKRHGFQLRQHRDGNELILWVEKVDQEPAL